MEEPHYLTRYFVAALVPFGLAWIVMGLDLLDRVGVYRVVARVKRVKLPG
jgi:hypothetical protein